MTIEQKIDIWVAKHNLLKQGMTIVIGLSGGPDSVFLLHYLIMRQKELGLTLVVAHLNHEWRADAKTDEEFCKKLAQELHIPYETSSISKLDCHIKPSGSKEQDARKARRYFFKQIATMYNAHAIALAQHEDDQQETFFIRLLRGSTLTGLAGMWPKRGIYIRPLLCITKAEIMEWLHKHRITCLTDPTNTSPEYLRNRIRNMVLPILRQIDPRFSLNFTKTINHLQETERFLQNIIHDTFASLSHFDTTLKAWIIDTKALLSLNKIVQYRVLVHWLSLEQVNFPASEAFFHEIIRFLGQPISKSHNIHSRWHIVKRKNHAYIKHVAANT